MRIFIRLLVVFIVISAVAMIPAIKNWDSYTEEFAKSFKAETGFDMEIGGDVKFKMFPRPNLYLKDVKIGELVKANNAKVEIVKAAGISLYVKYFPLFFNSIIPIDINLIKPEFNARHIKGDEFDVSKYLFKKIVKKEDIPSFDLNSNMDVDNMSSSGFNFNKLNMTEGTIRIVSEQFKRTYVLENVEGQILIGSASGPFDVNLGFKYKNVPYSFTFNASELSKSIDTSVNLKLTRKDNKTASFTIKGAVDDKDGKKHFFGTFDGDFSSVKDNIEPFIPLADAYKEFTDPLLFNFYVEMNGFFRKINNVKATLRLGPPGENSTNGNIGISFDDDRKMTVDMQFSKIIAKPFMKLVKQFTDDVKNGKSVLAKDLKGTATGKIDTVFYKGDFAKSLTFSADFKDDMLYLKSFGSSLPGDGHISANGKFTNGEKGLSFDGETKVAFENFDTFMKSIGITVPPAVSGSYRKAGIDAKIVGDVTSFKVSDIVSRLDAIDIVGDAEYTKKENGNMVKMKLSSKTINLDPYVKAPAPFNRYTDFLTVYIEKIKNLLPFDYDLSLKSKTMTYLGNTFDDFNTEVISIGDKILVKDFSASDVGGMKISLMGGIGKSDNSLYGFKAEVDTKNVLSSDLGKLFKYLKIKIPNLNRLKSANIISEFNGNASNLAVSSVIKSDTMTVGINGNFGDNYKYEIDVTHPNFKTFLGLFQDYYHPDAASVWFKFRTDVYNDNGKVMLKNINSSIGSMRFTGTGSIETLANGRNMYSFTMDTPELDIDKLLPKGEFVFWHNKDKSQVAWSKDDMDLSGLLGYDAKISLSAGKTELSPLSIGKTLFAVDLENQNMIFKATSDEFYEGKAKIDADFAFSGEPTAKVSFEMDNVLQKAPLFSAKILDLASGTYNGKVNLTMIGKSMYSMFTNVNGNGNLNVKNGTLTGVSLSALPKYQNVIINDKEYITADDLANKLLTEMNNGQIDFTELKSQLIINNGVIRLLDAGLTVPDFNGKVSGVTINIPEWTIVAGADFSINADTSGRMAYLTLNGNLTAPDKVWNIKNFAEGLAKIATDNKALADAKASQNLADVGKYLQDTVALESKARIYVSELKEMADKERAIIPVYEKSAEELRAIENMGERRLEVQKILDAGVASVNDVALAKSFYDDFSSHCSNIEKSRTNTVSEAARAMVNEYAKNAMTSANAVMSLVANNSDNEKLKSISASATANAIKVEVLVQKAETMTDADELKVLQASAVKLALENINLEASAREEVRLQKKAEEDAKKSKDAEYDGFVSDKEASNSDVSAEMKPKLEISVVPKQNTQTETKTTEQNATSAGAEEKVVPVVSEKPKIKVKGLIKRY